jgi:hypothetical protein
MAEYITTKEKLIGVDLDIQEGKIRDYRSVDTPYS